MTINVLIVDDSASVREALGELIDHEPDMAVMGKVGDPFQAAERIRKAIPDVMILDIEMPRMDGLTFLKRIMAQRPIPVIICSTLVNEGSPAFLEALRSGAVDVIAKPRLGTAEALRESRIAITDKVRGASQARRGGARGTAKAAAAPLIPQEKLTADALLPKAAFHAHRQMRQPIIAIGASTGGTQAIEAVLGRLDPSVPGIVLVQHMPEGFTRAFAQRLNEVCRLRVKEAAEGDPVTAGTALVAPGNRHLIVRAQGPGYRAHLLEGPLVSRHRPSVDVLFRAVAQAAGPAALGVILTGMGDDGARGMAELKEAGARTVAQNQASCVVYGMPAEAAKRGVVDKQADLPGISRLLQAFGKQPLKGGMGVTRATGGSAR